MKRVFLIGDPVGHSVSPEMHNAAFRALGFDWRYELLPTPRESQTQAVETLRSDDCMGGNVTIPHKETIMPYLDGISEQARQIGAVNTIIKRDGRLIGENTDAEGFLSALADAKVELKGSRAVILGAGGAARAAAFALARGGVRSIALLNRTEPRAKALATLVYEHFTNVEFTLNQVHQLEGADIIVNATSVGMSPNANACPWPRNVGFPRGAVAFDLVYRPRRTRFLVDAEQAGCRTIGGLGMLVYQGAAAFRLWTECEPPTQVMFRVAEQALSEQVQTEG